MAAWTESERAQIRHALGFGAIFLQAYPLLENAMTSVLATADNGTRPDSSTQVQIQGWLTDLGTVETSLKSLWVQAQVTSADRDVELDVARGTAVLKQEGRRIVGYIASALATNPKRDIFSTPHYGPDGQGVPFDITGGRGF